MNLKFSCLLAVVAAPLLAGMAQAANPDHVSRLETSKQCNQCDLSGADLSAMDLSGAQLVGANLNTANLVNANLSGANLTEASLVAANLVGANLRQANLTKTTFVYANLTRGQLQGATLLKTDLQGANLAEADFSGAKVSDSSFTNANLYQIKLPASVTNASGRAYDANGNTFSKTTLRSLNGDGGTISRSVVTQGGVDTYEAGGTTAAPTRSRRRSYKIPTWIGIVHRSTAGGVRFHNPTNPDLTIELW
jgi:hypothetical protein